MFVTSPFGMRTDPMDAGKQQMHKGIDIRCKGDAVLATENNGKVVAVNHNANTAGGKSVTIEYPRSDGEQGAEHLYAPVFCRCQGGRYRPSRAESRCFREYRDTDYRRTPAFRSGTDYR